MDAGKGERVLMAGNESNKCIMKDSWEKCKGTVVLHIRVGDAFVDLCVHHAVLLKNALSEEGF